MQVTKTIKITTTGVLTVTVTPTPSKGYVGKPFSIRVRATPWTGPAPMHFEIAYGDGTSIVKDVSGDNVTVSKIYTTTGIFTITAKATDLQTGATGTGSNSVEVRSQLVAALTADKTTGNIPLTVTFTMSWSGGYSPYTAMLDPGDGAAPYSVTPGTKAHTYEKVGFFTAKLTVTDALGLGASMTWILDIISGVVSPELYPWITGLAAAVPILAVLAVIAAQELKTRGIIQ